MELKYHLIIIYILVSLFFILSIVFIFKIINDTSSGNPLELEKESDKLNYFKNDTYSYFQEKEYCICEDSIYIDFCNEDLLKLGCKNYYPNKKLNFKMEVSECKQIQNSIMNKNLTLIDIFTLKTNSINSSIISLVVFNFILFIISFLSYPIFTKYISSEEDKTRKLIEDREKKREEKGEEKTIGDSICDCCLWYHWGCFAIFLFSIIYFLIIVFLIINIIVFSIACGIYNADDTSKFLDFLECANVKKEGFSKYNSLEDLSSHFISLKIFESLFIISIFISGLYILILINYKIY